jgi:hypothetical protein
MVPIILNPTKLDPGEPPCPAQQKTPTEAFTPRRRLFLLILLPRGEGVSASLTDEGELKALTRAHSSPAQREGEAPSEPLSRVATTHQRNDVEWCAGIVTLSPSAASLPLCGSQPCCLDRVVETRSGQGRKSCRSRNTHTVLHHRGRT